jgi:hypothetical protein
VALVQWAQVLLDGHLALIRDGELTGLAPVQQREEAEQQEGQAADTASAAVVGVGRRPSPCETFLRRPEVRTARPSTLLPPPIAARTARFEYIEMFSNYQRRHLALSLSV